MVLQRNTSRISMTVPACWSWSIWRSPTHSSLPGTARRHFGLWQPGPAIQQGENDGNPATAGDPAWQPLERPALFRLHFGSQCPHGCGNSHARAVLRERRHDLYGHERISPAKQKTRTYKKFSDMQTDVVNVRIYQGIHFRFAKQGSGPRKAGGRLGLQKRSSRSDLARCPRDRC